MEKTPIGLIIKGIVHEKKLSPTKIAKELGMSKQQVYNTYLRTHMNEDDLEKWAAALRVTVDDLLGQGLEKSNLTFDGGAFAESVVAKIQEMFADELKEKNNEIREKNEQIRALQKALEQAQNLSTVLLGKSPEYSDRSIIPLHRNRIQALAGV